MPAKKTLTDKQYAEYLSMLSDKQYNNMTRKNSKYKAGTFKVKTKQYGTVKTKAALRRAGSSAATIEKAAPLPESCHYSKSAANKAADVLRVKKIKSRVVTSGKFFCVYSVRRAWAGYGPFLRDEQQQQQKFFIEKLEKCVINSS
jgi:hypothetical protein